MAAVVLIALTFRPVVEGDGIGYYSYLHAILVSHSLDLGNEYAAAIASRTPLYLPWVTTRTASGHLSNIFAVGSAVLSMPAFLVALALHPSGEPQYGSPFVEAFTLSSLLYGLIGLAICYRLAEAVIKSRRAAAIGVLGALFATPLVYYSLTDPSYAHTFSVFCVSAFLYAWWKGPPRTYQGWLGLGALGGLMAMTRFQDGALMALVLIDVKRLRWPALLLVPGALVAFTPQFVVDQQVFGTWLPQRPPGMDLNPLSGHFLSVLLASQDGLLVWTPAALLAGIGCFFLTDRRLRLACLIAFLIELAIIGSAPDDPGVSFGARRFLELIPFAALGIAAAAARLGSRFDWAVVGALCVWNFVFLANFEYVMVGVNDPGYGGLLRGQLSAIPFVPRLFAKGAVVRDLLLWRQAHVRFDPLGGITLLALEAACFGAGLAAAGLFTLVGPVAGSRHRIARTLPPPEHRS